MADKPLLLLPGAPAPHAGAYRDPHGTITIRQKAELLPPVPGGGAWEYVGQLGRSQRPQKKAA